MRVRRHVRAAASLREIFANLRAYWFLTALLAILAAVVGAGFTAVLAAEVSSFEAESHALDARGRNVVIVTGESGVSASTCEAIARNYGVVGSGALISSEAATLQTSVRRPVFVRSATPGYLNVIWPGARKQQGLLLGSEVAESLGVIGYGRAWVELEGRTRFLTAVSGATSPSLRDPDSDRSAYRMSLAQGTARSCLVEAEYGAVPGVLAFARQEFSDSTPVVAPLYVPDASVSPPEVRFTERSSDKILPLVGVLVFAVALLGVWLIRAKDFALYRLLDFPARTIVATLISETFLLVAIPFFLGVLITAALTPPLSSLGVEIVFFASVKVLAGASLIPLVGLWMVMGAQPDAVLRR